MLMAHVRRAGMLEMRRGAVRQQREASPKKVPDEMLAAPAAFLALPLVTDAAASFFAAALALICSSGVVVGFLPPVTISVIRTVESSCRCPFRRSKCCRRWRPR